MGAGHFDGQRVSGQFPQHGAIFMSDNFTRKECFQRKLFGLPSKFLNFVSNVKAGMPLFLFDYQVRKLYGVFEATKDGAMNIVPHAYKSSGMNFPAQVHFKIIWRCYPVPEHVFCEAIKENYYAHNKFHFGLSGNQVQKLLHLFEKRRIRIETDWSFVQKRKADICCHIAECAVESQYESIDNSEPPSISTPETPTSSGVVDVGTVTDLASEDFIPLPSSDIEEEPESPKSDEYAEGCSDVFQGYTIASRSLCETRDKVDKLTDSDSRYQVKRLYSDCPKERISAFHRLSRTSSLTNEAKGPCSRKMDDSVKILERLDSICNEWKTTNAKRASPSNEGTVLKSRKSVFSRLSFNSVKAPESKERQYLKCKQSWTVKNVSEIEDIIAENKEKNDSCLSGEQKKRRLDGNSANVSFETKSSDHGSIVPEHVEGCSADNVDKTSDETSFKNSPTDDSKFMTFPSICEGDDTQNKHSLAGNKKCTENAVTKPFITYQLCQSDLSVIKEPAEKVFVEMCEAGVNTKSCKDGDDEKEDEFPSPTLCVQTYMHCPSAQEKHDI